MLRKAFYQMIDRVNWYLYRRACLSIYMSACSRADKVFPRTLPSVYNYVQRQQLEGGLGGYFTAMKLIELTHYLEKQKPVQIIEFGGGATTAVFAEYAHKNSGVRFISVDESQHYQSLTQERLSPILREKVIFVHSSRVERDWRGTRVCHYDHTMLPALGMAPWLCYVDGPVDRSNAKSSEVDGRVVKLPCVDVVMLAATGTQVADVLFDCRFVSVGFAMRSEEFYNHIAKLHFRAAETIDDWALIDQHCYHSVLLRVNSKTKLHASDSDVQSSKMKS